MENLFFEKVRVSVSGHWEYYDNYTNYGLHRAGVTNIMRIICMQNCMYRTK